ncbi:MAG: hypothetical protein RI897_3345 [Verrucomicrobiota bacterium]|jgi:ERCC4-type nuclease
MAALIRIVVDHRELAGGVPQALEELEGVELEVRCLGVGDYFLDNRVLVERKAVLDLVSSIRDGRLFRQARRLASGEHTGVILVEGRWEVLAETAMRREAVQGAIVSLGLIYGLTVFWTEDVHETARVLWFAAQQLSRVREGVAIRHGVRPKSKRRLQQYLVEGLPGVGPSRAKALLEKFGGVSRVFGATREELLEVDGVGGKLADRILWALQ